MEIKPPIPHHLNFTVSVTKCILYIKSQFYGDVHFDLAARVRDRVRLRVRLRHRVRVKGKPNLR